MPAVLFLQMSLSTSRHFASAILLAIALSLVLNGPSLALAPSPAEASVDGPSLSAPARTSRGGPQDETRPIVMEEAAKHLLATRVRAATTPPSTTASVATVAAPARPLREVFAFADAGSLADSNRGYPSWDFTQLSTVAYFGLSVASTGDFVQSGVGWTEWNSSDLAAVKSRVQNAGGKLLLTIVLQSDSNNTNAQNTALFCSALANAATTVNRTVDEVKAKGVAGVNIDYEWAQDTCPDGQALDAKLVNFTRQLRSALPAGQNYLTIDTYAGSAEGGGTGGFYNIPALNPYVDAFFVMAYALEYSNWKYPPLNSGCSSFCLSPTSPLSGYRYNDTLSADQYAALVGAGKVILGFPYYGDKACVGSPAPNAVSTGNYATSDYLYNKGIRSQSTVSNYAEHRDSISSGQERWDTYYFNDTSPGGFTCWRELYWDDATSLAQKYQLVLNRGLRGAGLWNLNMGGGTAASPELWSTLARYFNPAGGYNILTSFGGIYSFGDARYYGNLIDHHYPGPAIGLAETPTGAGYNILTTFGGIYSFGDAEYDGNLIDHGYPGPAVALAMTPTGRGYAILTAFGGIYTFGDARYYGNLIDHGYPGPAVGLSYTSSGNGYAILTASGGIYTFGDAPYLGNLVDHHYPGPAVSLAYTRTGGGYSILTQSGGLYTFGDAVYQGNLLDHGYPGPAVAISDTP